MKINDLLNITEGVNDPHIFKALFVIGSSGSGKTTVAKYLTSSTGMKVVDVDKYYEYLKKSNTLTTLTTSNSQLSNDLAWDRAKVLNTNQFSSYITGRLGVAIINTGKNYEKMKRVISTLEEIGYDISILYIRSVKDDAITRNSLRKRKVDSEDLENIYSEVEKNALMYNLEFSEKFVIYDNITSEKITANFDNPRVFHSSTYKTLNKWFQQWINSPVKAASDWKKSEEKNEKTSNVNKINQHKVEIKQNLRVK